MTADLGAMLLRRYNAIMRLAVLGVVLAGCALAWLHANREIAAHEALLLHRMQRSKIPAWSKLGRLRRNVMPKLQVRTRNGPLALRQAADAWAERTDDRKTRGGLAQKFPPSRGVVP
jgi:hypothetical protein